MSVVMAVPLPSCRAEERRVGSVSRIPATGIEAIIIKSLNEHLIAQKEKPSSSSAQVVDRKLVLEQVARIDVHENNLTIRFKSDEEEETPGSPNARSLSIPWQKPSSRKSRQILVPHGVTPNEVRPTRSSDGHGWSTQSHAGVVGLTRSSRAR